MRPMPPMRPMRPTCVIPPATVEPALPVTVR